MKILSPAQIRAVDQATIAEEDIPSIDLMERASMAFVRQLTLDFPHLPAIHVFCGPGNNGGDGLAIARLLAGKGLPVRIYDLSENNSRSGDNAINRKRAEEAGIPIHYVASADDLDGLELEGLIVDAMLGSGLNSPLRGTVAEAAEFLNRQPARIASVDMPSGLFSDKPSTGPVIKADVTYTFQLPKLGLLLPENAERAGRWKVMDIGLSARAIEREASEYQYNTLEDMRAEYLPRRRFSHKGSHGHALLIAGSRGKAGAAVLAARAALRSGIGLLTVHLPSDLLDILQTAVPEAMCQTDADAGHFTGAGATESYKTVGIGPGLGQHPKTMEGFSRLLDNFHQPMVVDADALNLMAAHPELLEKLPPLSILTPHPGEFERLAGASANDYERLEKLRQFAARYQVIVVLKGAHTAIARPDGRVSFNSTGNNGMATAGSGDALTGLITGLLAQGYVPDAAARVGVFLHGLAGDLALKKEHVNSLIASDIIDHFGQAFHQIAFEV